MKQIRQLLRVSGVVLGAMALGFVLALVFVPQLTGNIANAIENVPPPDIATSNLLSEQERIFGEIYDTVSPSVVSITISEQASPDAPFEPVSIGSGFVVDTQGHIITNYHVVAREGRIEIAMYDGTIALAQVVGEDPTSDLAVLQVQNVPVDRLHPVAFANSDDLQVGETVLALGNPFQNEWTLTNGIISALNRRIFGLNRNSIGGVIQTDAAINPGNSGGPLLNLHGEVIGVNSQINSESRSNSGVGFAIPSNLVRKVATSLIETGTIEYSFIGIGHQNMSLDLISDFNLPNNIRGVVVDFVQRGAPADIAGLQSMTDTSVDVITAINGQPVSNFDVLIGYLYINTNPGDTITLTVYRNGQVLELPVTVVSR
ncbi:MAG: trypsin-like peptidase domain-containing protein [Anaerolineae bacterium]|nr:trypsin-like peptidase domain-containing protein [Anaerolineae bacterium]MDQ7034195.1 trypsin-like peptidase domain-containing protein [Anaerolineae bacterium]